MKKHQKHATLSKPEIGKLGRNEMALVGAPCGIIQELVKKIIANLPGINCTFVDADHAFGDSESSTIAGNELTDKIKFHRYDKKELNDFDKRILLNDQDFILTNGNHFEAAKQIVLIHPKKEDSLKKRLAQLTDVKAYVLCDGLSKPFDWLQEAIGKKPILVLENDVAISTLIKNSFKTPAVKGLILAGGQSLRMGSDKGLLDYHGLSQVDYLIEEFKTCDIEPYVSCRTSQYETYNRITDKFECLGPYGAILSAFQSDPNAAWLVVACDLPFVNAEVFNTLLDERNPAKFATCFYNQETDFPDPLITLWEPKSYMRLLEFLALGYSCPRKVLINSDVKVIKPKSPDILRNVNTPEEKIGLTF
jgi:molybdopterin-guanine dinucleotide biosynthesis protein A